MSDFWAQNTRKRPGPDDKSASLPKSQWVFSEGVNLGKYGIIWFLISIVFDLYEYFETKNQT
jgi:hypothetical protein